MEKEKDIIQEEVEETEVEETETEKVDLVDLINTDEEIQKQFQSELDRAITKAIQTRDKKHQEELKEQERRAKMTASELQAEKERELEEREQQLRAAELKLAKVDHFKEHGLPLEFVDLIHISNEDEIEEKIGVFKQQYDEMVKKEVQQAIKSSGINLENEVETEVLTIEDLEGMTADEINKNWEKLL